LSKGYQNESLIKVLDYFFYTQQLRIKTTKITGNSGH